MKMNHIALSVLLAMGLAACQPPEADKPAAPASGDTASAGKPAAPNADGSVNIAVNDSACEPMELTVPSGKTTFNIKNNSGRKLEWEILEGVMVVDERENIAPGLSDKMTVTLLPGTYEMTCGLLTNPRGKLIVTDSGFKAEAGRYHLYVSLACPWAHRALVFRRLKGLTDLIDVSVVHPDMLSDGWTFDTDFPGATGDKLFGLPFARDLYIRADPNTTGHVTVPILWDMQRDTIVSNESAEIIRMFDSAFDGITGSTRHFCPPDLAGEIEAVNARVYRGLNNGVYRAGFATTQ